MKALSGQRRARRASRNFTRRPGRAVVAPAAGTAELTCSRYTRWRALAWRLLRRLRRDVAGKQHAQVVVDASAVRAQEVGDFDVEGRAIHARHATAGFRNDQRAGRHVPGLEARGPVTVEAP